MCVPWDGLVSVCLEYSPDEVVQPHRSGVAPRVVFFPVETRLTRVGVIVCVTSR